MPYQTMTIGAALLATALLAGGCGNVSESNAATPGAGRADAATAAVTTVALYNEYKTVNDDFKQLEKYRMRLVLELQGLSAVA